MPRTMTQTTNRRKANATGSRRSARSRRRSAQRLRNAYFSRAGELVRRYSVRFERVLVHLWRARRTNRRLLLRHVTCIEDLVLIVACIDHNERAWKDFKDHFERSLGRRSKDGSEDPGAMVDVRRFIATLHRDSLSGRSMLEDYAGTRPLRSWLSDALVASMQRHRRSAFVLDPADSCCGEPLRFVRTGV